MKMNLEKGDPCFVRLKNGFVVAASYDFHVVEKWHRVEHDGLKYVACENVVFNIDCRFVYPLSEMKRQMGLQ